MCLMHRPVYTYLMNGGRKIVHYTEEMDTIQAKGENELAPDLRQTEFSFFARHEEYITGRLRTG